jgi:hypothetical protein
MLVLLVGWAGLRAGTGGHAGDFPLYEQYARRCLDGEVPYRDFGVEYPPASLLVMVLPALLPGPYEAWFALEMGTFALGTLALTLSVADLVGADRQRTAVAFMVGVLALSCRRGTTTSRPPAWSSARSFSSCAVAQRSQRGPPWLSAF